MEYKFKMVATMRGSGGIWERVPTRVKKYMLRVNSATLAPARIKEHVLKNDFPIYIFLF